MSVSPSWKSIVHNIEVSRWNIHSIFVRSTLNPRPKLLITSVLGRSFILWLAIKWTHRIYRCLRYPTVRNGLITPVISYNVRFSSKAFIMPKITCTLSKLRKKTICFANVFMVIQVSIWNNYFREFVKDFSRNNCLSALCFLLSFFLYPPPSQKSPPQSVNMFSALATGGKNCKHYFRRYAWIRLI